MHEEQKRDAAGYPVGRGYGHDYMRGGEVNGGYGYAARPEYEMRRGDTGEHPVQQAEEEELTP